MTIAARFVRDRQRAALWWALAMVLLVGSTVAIFPTVEGQESFDRIFDELPDTIRALVGTQADIPISSAPGYLHARLFSTIGPLVLLIYGIGLGARATGASEEDGTLELLLANPVTRLRVVGERFVAVAALVLWLSVVFTAATLVLAPTVGLLEGVSVPGLLATCAATAALALMHTAIAFGAGAMSGRRSVALAAGSIVAIAGYVLYGFAVASEPLRVLRFVTPWHWFLSRNMLVNGVAIEALVLPVVVAAVAVAVGVAVFGQRDLRLAT